MDNSEHKEKDRDDPNKKRVWKTPSIQSANPGSSLYLGKCMNCGHMGDKNDDCKQCDGDMMAFPKFDPNERTEFGFDFSNYRFCENCENVQEDNKICRHCIMEGIEKETDDVSDIVEAKLIEQKCLPRCALQHFYKCNECLETAQFLGKQMPIEINMASNILKLVREYDALVEVGYKIHTDKKQDIKQDKRLKFLFEPTSLDLTTEKLKSLIEHHHKLCLCSICKFWIISNAKQDKL